MKDNIVDTLLEASHIGREKRGGGIFNRAFVMLLFAVLALFLLIALLVGTNSYRSVNDARMAADETRLGLSLISNSIRTNDTTDAVGVAQGPEGRALVLTETLPSGAYETRLYAHEGAIVQEYARADAPYTPGKAREVVASQLFDFSFENGLLTVYTDQGSTAVALRSVRGGS